MLWGITDRRHFMKHAATTAALATPSLAFLDSLKAQQTPMKKNHKAVIILHMGGGASTLDMFTPLGSHPNNGAFKAIKTPVSGMDLQEPMVNLAKQAKNLAVIRSLATTEGDHMRGTQLMQTSFQPSPLVQHPSMGAMLAYQYREQEGDLPAFISVGGGGGDPGFLGMRYASFSIQNPGQPPENIRPPQEIEGRMDRRANLFGKLETSFKTGMDRDAVKAHREVYEKALSLVVAKNKDVFSLSSAADTKDVEKYGNNNFGRGCLLARKLVEAGAVAVNVNLGGWDNHQNIFTTLHNTAGTGRADILDKGFAALIEDLAQRGMLKNTVVLFNTEFSRTPRINQNGGRDHYPRAWSIALAGGTIKGGTVHGSLDEGGENVKDGRVTVSDVFATVYKALGLDPTSQVRDNLGRPMAIAGEKAKAIETLVG
jgi:uncharacterized protein (DUF1501 family)